MPIGQDRRVVRSQDAKAEARDPRPRQASLDGGQQLAGDTPTAKRGRYEKIGDKGEAVGIGRFDDRIRLLDPARHEADERPFRLGHQNSAALFRATLDPGEIGVGDLLPGQTGIMEAMLMVLEFDDRAPKISAGRRGSRVECEPEET